MRLFAARMIWLLVAAAVAVTLPLLALLTRHVRWTIERRRANTVWWMHPADVRRGRHSRP